MNGIININKPSGVSSNKVVSIIKKTFNQKKVGHLGTLDPLASGVLPVCIGKATRLFDLYLNKTKEYVAEFTFSIETDTLDSEGKIINQIDYVPSIDEIKNALKNFIGKINQLPPKFSAKNINGKRAYQLAKSGEDFELKPKEVEIYSFELLKQINENTFEFLISCSSGTYIRSLARDLGFACKTCAYMSKLTRTKAGEFKLDDAVNLDEIKQDNIVPLEKVLSKFEKIIVDDENYDKLKNGVKTQTDIKDKKNIVIVCKNEIFGIGEIKQKRVFINTYLHD